MHVANRRRELDVLCDGVSEAEGGQEEHQKKNAEEETDKAILGLERAQRRLAEAQSNGLARVEDKAALEDAENGQERAEEGAKAACEQTGCQAKRSTKGGF